MASLPRSLARLSAGVALGTSVAACLLSTPASAASAPSTCNTTTDGISVVLASQSGSTLGPACVTQQGNVLIIVLPSNTPGTTPQTQPVATVQPGTSLINTPATSLINTPATSLVNTPATPTTTTSLITPTPPIAQEGNMSAVVDPRINSYAKRQAIRDQYRGQIDEVTFNDELGDGVPVETALADAIAAYNHPHP
jgi:hypothetical protein